METVLKEQTNQKATRETLEEVYNIKNEEFKNVCKPGDTECLHNWINAFSDCV